MDMAHPEAVSTPPPEPVYAPEEYELNRMLAFELPLYRGHWKLFERLVSRGEAEALVHRNIIHTVLPGSAAVVFGSYRESGIATVDIQGHVHVARSRTDEPTIAIRDMLSEAVDGIMGGYANTVDFSWYRALQESRVQMVENHPSHQFFYLAAVTFPVAGLPRGIYYGWKPQGSAMRLRPEVR